ncbi:MAG: hypothetical protein JRL30_17255 [Deltaproteobacteria bacterium]|nr:hypothetical protein [Deltaproteobacteria bacterium]
MRSVVTAEYQTTIPKDIRSQLKLSVSDTLFKVRSLIPLKAGPQAAGNAVAEHFYVLISTRGKGKIIIKP